MKRIVITGLGVISPVGNTLRHFNEGIRAGKSGIRFIDELKEKKFKCQVGGIPVFSDIQLAIIEEHGMTKASTYLQYALIAGLEAWADAGLPLPVDDPSEEAGILEDTGSIIGTGFAAIDIKAERLMPFVDSGQIHRLRSDIVEQAMINSPSTLLTRLFGLGNINFANSNACATGTDAILMAVNHIRYGNAKRMIAGGIDIYSPYYWGLFDIMRVMCPDYNQQAEKASRPMSASAGGFVPAAGAAILVLEDLESAMIRGAKIYAEISGGYMNTGGQRNGGSMTAANHDAVVKCISNALDNASTQAEEVDLIAGHLTATKADPYEIADWKKALQRSSQNFPLINSLKSMTGHLLGASGAIETIAAVLQLRDGYVHGNLNCEDLHPKISDLVSPDCIPQKTIEKQIHCVIKASFGFGDVNSCLVLKKFNPEAI